MAHFTLDIKDNVTEVVKTYTIKYTLQTNHMYMVDLFDDKGKLLFESGCDGALVCFDKVKNFIYAFGKILDIHQKHINEENKSFREQLLSKIHTLTLNLEGVKFHIRYYDDRTDVTSFGTNLNGLIKILLLDDAGRTKEYREDLMNQHLHEIIANVKEIVRNNAALYDKFDIIYKFDEVCLNTNSELIKTFKINPKSESN